MNLIDKLSKNYIITIALLVIAIYIKILGFETTGFGDSLIVFDNYERISNISGIVDEFSKSYPNSDDYKPLTMFSFYVNALVSGQNLYAYYFTNIFIHILVCTFLFKFLTLLNLSKNISLISSLLFSAHPFIAGNIALIYSRSYLLMSIFAIISLIFVIKYFQNRNSRQIWISGLFVFLSVLSDFSGFLLVPLILLYSVVYHKDIFKEEFNIIISPLLVVVIIWSLLYSNVELSGAGNIISESSNIFSVAGLFFNINVLQLIPESTGKFILPLSISTLPSFTGLSTILGAVVLIAISILPFLIFKNIEFKRNVALGNLFLLTGITASVVSLTNNNSIDYNYLPGFAYFPLIGMIVFLSSILNETKLKFDSKIDSILIIVIIAILSFISFFQLDNYKSEEKFIETAYENNSGNDNLKLKLVEIYLQKSDSRKAIDLISNDEIDNSAISLANFKIGNYFYKLENYDSAISYFEKIRQFDSLNKPNLNLLVNSYYKKKDFDNSIKILISLAADTLRFPEARWDLFNIYLESKKFEEAGEYGKYTFISDDDKMRALQMVESWSKIFFDEKDNVAVVKVMKTGLELDPDNAIILNYLYDTYMKIGLKDKAREYEKRLMKIFREQVMSKSND